MAIRSIGMKNLSATTISKIRRMIDAVVAEPQYYDQDTFHRDTYGRRLNEPECGTVCCGAGFAVWCESPKEYAGLLELDKAHRIEVDWARKAVEALDLEYDDRQYYDDLFGQANEWPAPFCDQYYKAHTAKERARAFQNRWEHFIANDGEEYE